MSVQTIHDTGSENTILSRYDGGVYSLFSDCIIKGIGDEFTITYNSSSKSVGFSAGSECLIGGSFFKVTADETISLDSNSTIYLCATIDLSRQNGQRGYFSQRTATNMRSGNLNGNDQARDFLLYIVTTDGNGVTSVQDKRKIVGDHTSINNVNMIFLTQEEYEALETKETNSLYYIIEETN